MSDFLTRLAERTLGVAPVVQPITASRFAPGQESAGSEVPGLIEDDALAASTHFSPESRPDTAAMAADREWTRVPVGNAPPGLIARAQTTSPVEPGETAQHPAWAAAAPQEPDATSQHGATAALQDGGYQPAQGQLAEQHQPDPPFRTEASRPGPRPFSKESEALAPRVVMARRSVVPVEPPAPPAAGQPGAPPARRTTPSTPTPAVAHASASVEPADTAASQLVSALESSDRRTMPRVDGQDAVRVPPSTNAPNAIRPRSVVVQPPPARATTPASLGIAADQLLEAQPHRAVAPVEADVEAIERRAPPARRPSTPDEQPPQAKPGPVAPVIRVTIGRIEVRAVAAPTPSPAPRPAHRGPKLSLDEYLRARNGHGS